MQKIGYSSSASLRSQPPAFRPTRVTTPTAGCVFICNSSSICRHFCRSVRQSVGWSVSRSVWWSWISFSDFVRVVCLFQLILKCFQFVFRGFSCLKLFYMLFAWKAAVYVCQSMTISFNDLKVLIVDTEQPQSSRRTDVKAFYFFCAPLVPSQLSALHFFSGWFKPP